MIIPNSSTEPKDTDQDADLSRPIKKSQRTSSFMIANNLNASFKYAAKGLSYTFSTQRNFKIHIFLGLFVSIFGVFLRLSFTNLAILFITIASVLALELLNTSLEALVDLTVGRSFNPLAQIAKDCAAASVLVASINSCIIAILLFLPPFLKYLSL